jgi:lysophospholipase L1-like esterase
LLLLAGSVAVSVLVLEAVFRIIAPRSPHGTTYGKPIRINSDGFRDREFVIPKAPGTYRILTLGDSFTWGVGLDVDETIPKLLEAELNAGSETRRFEVINAAIPGYNTLQEMRLLKNRGLKYDPDMVLLIYNLNDIDYKPEITREESREDLNARPVDPGTVMDTGTYDRRRGLRGMVLAMERHSRLVSFVVPRLGTLLRRAGLLGAEVSWVEKLFRGYTKDNPGWVESSESVREIAQMTKERGIRFVVGIYPLLVELDRYGGNEAHATIQALLDALRVDCVDLLDVFENRKGSSFWVNFADSHPNAEAHRMVAERIRQAVLPALQSPRRQDLKAGVS